MIIYMKGVHQRADEQIELTYDLKIDNWTQLIEKLC